MSFFAPPRRVETTVFTRLPDRFRKLRRSAWADVNREDPEIDSFLEGPSFDREGRLYVTDIPFGRVFRIDPAGEWEQIAEYDGWPNGLKIHRDGRIFITDYRRGLMLLDPASGRVSPFLETVGSESFKGVNDLVIARSGTIYFTDQGQTGMHDPTGRIYRLTPDGRLTCLIDTIPSPNGIVVDPEETALLVAVTRANQVWRVPLHKSGLVTKVGIFAHLHGGLGGPDGLALDIEGCLLVAHEGFGSVWRLSRHAEPLDRRACDDESRVWRTRQRSALHCGIRDRLDPASRPLDAGVADVLSFIGKEGASCSLPDSSDIASNVGSKLACCSIISRGEVMAAGLEVIVDATVTRVTRYDRTATSL